MADARPLPRVTEVDIAEAARLARRPRRTVLRWCRAGYLQARRYPSPRVRGARWLVTVDLITGRPAVAA